MKADNIFNATNSTIFVFGALGRYIVNFAILVIFARILSPSDYGYWIKLLAIFSIVQLIIEAGQMNILISQTNNFDKVFSTLLTWNFTLILFTYLLLIPILIYFLGFENYSKLTYLYIFLSLPFTLIANLLFGKVQFEKKFFLINILPFCIMFLGAIASILYVYFVKSTFEALAFKLFIESLISILLAVFFTGNYFYSRLPKFFEIKLLISKLNIFTYFGDLAIKVSNHIDKLFLSLILSPALLGFYSRAYAIGIIGVSVGGYSLTTLGIQSGASKNKKYKETNFMSLYLALISIVSFHLFYNYSDEILLIILGNNWKELVSLGWIISLMPAMKFFENFFYISCIGKGRSDIFTYTFLASYSISILIAILLYLSEYETVYVIFSLFCSALIIYLLTLMFFYISTDSTSELRHLTFAISAIVPYLIYNSFVTSFITNFFENQIIIISLDLLSLLIFIFLYLYIIFITRRDN